MVSIRRAWTSGCVARPESICWTPWSRIWRAVTVLPRASLGSETLKSPVRKLETDFAAAASRLARSRSLAMRMAWVRHGDRERKQHQHDAAGRENRGAVAANEFSGAVGERRGCSENGAILEVTANIGGQG